MQGKGLPSPTLAGILRHRKLMKGLQHDPNNEQLKEGLKEVRSKLASQQSTKVLNPFAGPDVITKLQNNPKTKSMLSDPSYLELIKDLQSNPNAMTTKLGDPRVLTTLSVLLGVDIESAGEAGDEPMETEPSPAPTVDPREAKRKR